MKRIINGTVFIKIKLKFTVFFTLELQFTLIVYFCVLSFSPWNCSLLLLYIFVKLNRVFPVIVSPTMFHITQSYMLLSLIKSLLNSRISFIPKAAVLKKIRKQQS
jgi:hypothetical protein